VGVPLRTGGRLGRPVPLRRSTEVWNIHRPEIFWRGRILRRTDENPGEEGGSEGEERRRSERRLLVRRANGGEGECYVRHPTSQIAQPPVKRPVRVVSANPTNISDVPAARFVHPNNPLIGIPLLSKFLKILPIERPATQPRIESVSFLELSQLRHG